MDSPAVHVLCVSCSQELDPSWSFCAACGADNRAPEGRAKVGFHSHIYPGHGHCVVCGQMVPDVDGMGRPVNRTWEAIKSVLGFLFFRGRWPWWDD